MRKLEEEEEREKKEEEEDRETAPRGIKRSSTRGRTRSSEQNGPIRALHPIPISLSWILYIKDTLR